MGANREVSSSKDADCMFKYRAVCYRMCAVDIDTTTFLLCAMIRVCGRLVTVGNVTTVVRYPTESAGAISQTPNIPRTDPGGLDMGLRSIRTVPYPRPSGSRGGHRGQNIYPRWGRGTTYYRASALISMMTLPLSESRNSELRKL